MPIPYISISLNDEVSQDLIKEIQDDAKRNKVAFNNVVDSLRSKFDKNYHNNGNNSSQRNRRGNGSIRSKFQREGRYFYHPNLYVKTVRTNWDGRTDRDGRGGLEEEDNLYRESNNTEATPARTRVQMDERIHELCDRLHLDNVEIVTDTAQLEGKQAKARGFYSKRTGKITIVLPNHTSVADAEQTLLHEAVAHHGLRQLFDEHFDAFLEKVYANASEDVRRHIATLASKNGWDFNKATEEYLATLVEDTDFENFNRGWFHKIKELFIGMLEKLGFRNLKNTTFNDNELRYILWRSYKNLSTPLSSNAPLVVAEDIAMQYGLGVGNYSPQSSAGDVLFREGDEVSPEAPSGIAVRADYRTAHQYLEFILENCDFYQLIWKRDEAGNRWIHVSCRAIGNRGENIRL